MLKKENIRHDSSQPLYLQVADFVITMIEKGKLHKNDILPSVNELYVQLGVSRVTVVNAYNYLRKQGVIAPRHGKGFFVIKESQLRTKNIFLLFDAMNNYKEVLYRAFINELGEGYSTDIFFHYYNLKQFGRFVNNNLGDYNHYVILPHFNVDVSEILKVIPEENLLLLDGDVATLKDCAGVFQQFETDVYDALKNGIPLLKKYSCINLFAGSDFQFIPDGIRTGLTRFCADNGFHYHEVWDNVSLKIKTGEVYLAFSENDLVTLMQLSKTQGFAVGKDFGIISYDDTPLKASLADGITTISTDFAHMGRMAAKMIKENIHSKIVNPCRLIIRNSL